MNKKKLKLIFLTSIFLVLIICVTSIYFFSQRDNNNNFIAIVEVRLSKSVDHIFLDTTADNVIIEYATRTLRNNLNNRIASFKEKGDNAKELQKSHALYDMDYEECFELLEKVKKLLKG